VACEINAFVDATESSLPQLRKTPQFSSLAKVDITLLTTFNLARSNYLALLKGIKRSIVSPD